MKYSLQIVGRDEFSTLPVLATITDVREAIRYLKHHPEGITMVQAMDAFRKRIFDARKVSAYEFWKIILRTGDRLKLTSLGWELAKCLTPEAHLYRVVLSNIVPYHSGLQWIHEQELELVTHLDIGNFWRENHADVLQGDDEKQLEAYGATFFQICHAAEVGMLTLGRKGQPTRLHIYQSELESYLNGNERTATQTSCAGPAAPKIVARSTSARPTSASLGRIFVSHHHEPELLKHIVNALELADLQFETLDRAEQSLDKTLAALERCDAAVIVIADDRVADELLLIQIGAALVHYKKRLLLVVNKGVSLPANIGDASVCEITNDFTWSEGLELMRSLKRFKLDEA